MAHLQDFLSALFAACPDDSIILNAGDVETPVTDGASIDAFVAAAGSEPIYVRPITDAGNVSFLHSVTENSTAEQWQDLSLRPTVVLFKDGVTICAYALEAPYQLEPEAEANAEIVALYQAMGGDLDDMIPTPGANGWEMVHCGLDDYQPLAALLEAFSDTPTLAAAPAVVAPAEESAPWEETDYGTLLDARVLAPIDLEAPELQQEMVISVGANFKSVNWKPDRMSIAKFIGLMARHPEGKQKDGPGFVMGEIVGDNRRKQAVTACFGVGLDIDVGMPGHEIDKALAELGCLAVRYTTFSHAKTSSKINKDKIVKWCSKQGIPFDDAGVIRFLRESTKWDEGLLATAEYSGDNHEPEGLMACISHAPMEKHRVVMPLTEAFVPTTVAETHAEGMKMWAAVCKALARRLGDLPMDNSTTDPSRLFYFPRHQKGKPHETTVFGGPLLDWRSLDLDGVGPVEEEEPKDAFEAALLRETKDTRPKSRSSTEEGKKLGRWAKKTAHGFQIVDVIRDHAEDRIRTNGGTKIDLECPFDEDHSNPGDAEDRGCFAVNAGDGPSEIFTIKCQHDSCQGRTNLDFLGKMIKDEWFSEDVLEDPNYNAAAPEDAPEPRVAMKIAAEDDARAEYECLIDALTPDSPDDDVEAALAAYVKAELKGLSQRRVEDRIKESLKINQTTLTKMVREVKRDVNRDRNQSGDYKDPKGRMVFSFSGEFNFDEAFDTCFKALLLTNKADKEPTFSCVQDKPVRLSRNPKTGRISFDELSNRTLWSELNKRVTFVRRSDNGDGTRQAVQKEVADHVYEQAWTELPQSPEIIYTPLFTANGDLVMTPGYKSELNLLMANTRFTVDVPETPDAAQVEEAVRYLKEELLIDFPFLDYDLEGVERREPSEANALAMLITPFMRRMINGCTPVFFVAKPVPGTGGTLLGKLPMLIFDGAESAPMRYTQSEEEMQKALLSAIIETRSHLFFDDVKDFNNRALLQSITSQEIGGRMLGVSRNISRPNIFNWVGTGNNPIVGSEMERRIVWVRINAKTSDIQTRVYHHDDLPGWIATNRSKIVGHILTMIQYWINVDCPVFETRKRASFEDWSRKVGGVLQACGVEGFLDNRRSAGADMDETAVRQFVKEWLKKFTFDAMLPSKLFEHALALELDIIEGNNDDQKKQRFPKRLHTLEGRAFTFDGTEIIVQTTLDADNNVVYYLANQGVTAAAPQDEAIAA